MPVGLPLYTLTGEATNWSISSSLYVCPTLQPHFLHFLCPSLSSGYVKSVVNSSKHRTYFVDYNFTCAAFSSWNTHPLSHIVYQLAPVSHHLLQEALLDSSNLGLRSLLNALITSCMPPYPTPSIRLGASFFNTECSAWRMNRCSIMLVK